MVIPVHVFEMIDEDLGEAFGVVSINGIIYLKLQLSPANPNILPYLLIEHRDTGDTALGHRTAAELNKLPHNRLVTQYRIKVLCS